VVDVLNTAVAPHFEAAAPRATNQSDRRISTLLFLGVLLIYLAVDTGQHYAYDGQAMVAVSMNLVNHGSVSTVGALNDVFHISTPYSPYGIGMSLLGVFPVALSKVFGHSAAFISLVNPVLTAAAVVVTYRVGRALGWLATEAVMAAIGFGLLSMALEYTTEYFSEPAVTLCILVMVLGIIWWGQGRRYAPLVVGLAAGCALQFRSDSLFTVWIGLLAVPLFVPLRRLRSLRALAWAIVPMAVSLALLIAYNEWRYSKLFVSSYGGAFTTPLWTGLHGYFLSSGKSIFVFNPLTILGFVGLALLFRRNRPLAILFTLLIATRMLFFARWSAWDGGWDWGPRFLLPIVPLLTISAVEVLRATRRSSLSGMVARVASVLLAVMSLVVNYLSVRVPYQQWLQVLNTPKTSSILHIDLSPAIVRSAYDFSPSTGPLWGDVLLLRHHLAQMGPELWKRGDGLVGLIFMAVGLSLVLWAIIGAQGARGHHAPKEHPGVLT
jgi:hypothetical protein